MKDAGSAKKIIGMQILNDKENDFFMFKST